MPVRQEFGNVPEEKKTATKIFKIFWAPVKGRPVFLSKSMKNICLSCCRRLNSARDFVRFGEMGLHFGDGVFHGQTVFFSQFILGGSMFDELVRPADTR